MLTRELCRLWGCRPACAPSVRCGKRRNRQRGCHSLPIKPASGSSVLAICCCYSAVSLSSVPACVEPLTCLLSAPLTKLAWSECEPRMMTANPLPAKRRACFLAKKVHDEAHIQPQFLSRGRKERRRCLSPTCVSPLSAHYPIACAQQPRGVSPIYTNPCRTSKART